MPSLRERVARLALENPERIRAHLVPLLRRTAAGTAEDITRNLPAFQSAYNDMVAAIAEAQGKGLDGVSLGARRRANVPWVQLMNLGYKIAEGILSTRSIPARQAKGLEMAYRLFSQSRRMPKDAYKWWAKNQKRCLLIITAANQWPEKQEGTDELFVLGSFRVHNTVGATGPELESLKKTVEMAEKMARRNPVKGFTRTVYGDIHVVARLTKAHHAAWYHYGDDSLYLRRAKRTGMDEVQSLVHELGHRYWAKFAPKEAKLAWLRHHNQVSGKPVDVEMPEVGDPVPVVHIRGLKGDPVVSRKDGANFYFDVKGEVFSIPYMRLYKLMREQTRRTTNFPTAYAAKDHEEHFCEALKLLAAGALTDEHAIPFKAIWS